MTQAVVSTGHSGMLSITYGIMCNHELHVIIISCSTLFQKVGMCYRFGHCKNMLECEFLCGEAHCSLPKTRHSFNAIEFLLKKNDFRNTILIFHLSIIITTDKK